MNSTASPRRPFAAWHVGREGEVAGGMTQVVNGYRTWRFDDFEVDVIVSRDGTHGPSAFRLFARAVAQIATLRDRRTAVVVVHLSQGGSFIREGALLVLARMTGVATVAHLHGSSFPAFARRRPALVRPVLRSAGLVLVLSEASAAAAARFVPGGRIRLVPNVVASDHASVKQRSVVFGGAITRRKGVDVLLDAWRRIAPDSWTLQLAGPLREPDLADDPPPGVVFHGGVPHDRLMAMLRDSAIAVLPSRDEALPMFLLEALARDACVVATAVGGVPELLEGGAGRVLSPGDAAELAEVLELLMRDDGARTRLVEAGRRRFAERYSAESGYPVIEAAWRDALIG